MEGTIAVEECLVVVLLFSHERVAIGDPFVHSGSCFFLTHAKAETT